MRSATLFFGASTLLGAASALTYELVDEYKGDETFFDKFTFFSGQDDGTGGYAFYQTRENAGDLISAGNGKVKFGADYHDTVDSLDGPQGQVGRKSIRIESTEHYGKGIWVADIEHMPGNQCGSWPAFWSFSDPWPTKGEIDIIEGVNFRGVNKASLHSGAGTCQIQDMGELDRGTLQAPNCQTIQDDGSLGNFAGCSIDDVENVNSFGDGFNNVHGGYYVTQWTDDFIKIWFFERGTEPDTLHDDVPDPELLGVPAEWFQGCDFGSKFSDQRLIFTTNFCGSWAGATGVYPADRCPFTIEGADANRNCRAFVANNPAAFEESYWEVNGIKIFAETADVDPEPNPEPEPNPNPISHPASSASSAPVHEPSEPPHVFSSVSAHNGSAIFHFPSHGPTASGHGNNGGSPTGGAHLPSGSKGSHGPAPTGGAHLPSGSKGVYPSGSKSGAKPTKSAAHGSYADPHNYPNGGYPAGCTPVHHPFTTTYTTKVVDVCPTGLTTSTVTTKIKYCPMCHEEPTKPYEGFTETVKVCSTGCGKGPVTVTLTAPVDNYSKPTGKAEGGKKGDYKGDYESPAKPSTPAAPVAPVKPSYPVKGDDYAPVKPAASAPAAPVYGGKDKDSYGAVADSNYGTKSYPSNTTATYKPLQVTANGASSIFASAFVMAGAAFAAIMML